MEKYFNLIQERLVNILPNQDVVLQITPNSKLGDIALPCFALAKKCNQNPIEFAKELINKIGDLKFIDNMEIQGGYINFYLNKRIVIEETITEIIAKREKYGSSGKGIGKSALIEHTSINPNASPHVGRARNAMIGDVLVRLLKFEGYNVNTHYFVNDVGKQIAMLVLGSRKVNDIQFKDLLRVYIDINEQIKENPSLEEDVFQLLYLFENGDNKVREEFRKVVDICITGQTNILNELGIKYDTFKYESDYIFSNQLESILQKLHETGKLFTDENGRKVLNLEGYNLNMQSPFLVLTRSDGTSLYPLRDIAYTIDKIIENPNMNLIVLGEDQKLYFQQICAVMKILGYDFPSVVHYSFVLLTDGKMSTRKGAVVLLEDFMKESLYKAKEYMQNNGMTINEEIAKSVAYGAVRYAILKVDNNKNVTFDWENSLNFKGDTGPYLLYSYIRIASIFNKYGEGIPTNYNLNLLNHDMEFDIIKDLMNFQVIVEKTVKELSPFYIANYLYSLTRKFSTYYHDVRVLCEDSELTKARLILIECVRQVIKNGLDILGIETVNNM